MRFHCIGLGLYLVSNLCKQQLICIICKQQLICIICKHIYGHLSASNSCDQLSVLGVMRYVILLLLW